MWFDYRKSSQQTFFFPHLVDPKDLKHLDWQRWVTAGSDSVPLFIGWERGISERRSGKQTESFFFRDTVILSSSYSSSSVRLLWRGISYILMMNMTLQRSYMEVWSQVAQDWQRDLPRQTARQIVILHANLTLSSERLMFLGKSHSTCCPCQFPTAGTGTWMDDRVKETGIQSAGKMERVGRMWVKEWIRVESRVTSLIGHHFTHLWLFLTSFNCTASPLMFTAEK